MPFRPPVGNHQPGVRRPFILTKFEHLEYWPTVDGHKSPYLLPKFSGIPHAAKCPSARAMNFDCQPAPKS